MEGSVIAEEPKSMQRGADASQGSSEHHRVKRKRVKKKRASSVQRGTDASQGEMGGDSKHHQVKRKKVKKECASRVQSGVDASHGQMFEGPESHLVKCKRIKKKRVSRVQGGTDASQGEMGGGSEPHQVKHKRVKKEFFSWFQRRTDASQGGSERHRVKHKKVKKERVRWFQRTDASQRQVDGHHGRVTKFESFDALVKDADLQNAKIALEFYEKSQDAEFEILEALNSRASRLRLPEFEITQICVHVCFTAKPKNADCSDVPPKHFFGELMKDDYSRKFKAHYCSTFEPSDDPGFKHGCIFCLPDEIHPGADGYRVGCPPWYKARRQTVCRQI